MIDGAARAGYGERVAKGRNAWTRRLLVIAAISVYALLLASGVLPNPLPGIWEWVGQERPLAPDLAWQERLGSRPNAAAVIGDTVTAQAGGRAEVRDRVDGAALRPTDPPGWEADWLLVTGAGDEAVVVTGERLSAGYQVRDPATGEVLYEDEDAVAVWGYREARLDLICDDQRACQVRGFAPGSDTPEWTTDLPGRRVGMQGANPPLAGPRTVDPDRIAGTAAGPPRLPKLLGFPVERRDGDGRVAGPAPRRAPGGQPGRDEKVIVVGERVIRSVTTRHNDVFSAPAAHGASGEPRGPGTLRVALGRVRAAYAAAQRRAALAVVARTPVGGDRRQRRARPVGGHPGAVRSAHARAAVIPQEHRRSPA